MSPASSSVRRSCRPARRGAPWTSWRRACADHSGAGSSRARAGETAAGSAGAARRMCTAACVHISSRQTMFRVANVSSSACEIVPAFTISGAIAPFGPPGAPETPTSSSARSRIATQSTCAVVSPVRAPRHRVSARGPSPLVAPRLDTRRHAGIADEQAVEQHAVLRRRYARDDRRVVRPGDRWIHRSHALRDGSSRRQPAATSARADTDRRAPTRQIRRA